jgi:hypothetical protein
MAVGSMSGLIGLTGLAGDEGWDVHSDDALVVVTDRFVHLLIEGTHASLGYCI